MRDLLYLSENKMRVLSPQVPQKLWKKAGFEAGVNIGLASFTTTLPGESPQPSVAMLDPVVEMIEQERRVKWFTDEALQVGDWIQFEDNFFYGDAAPAGMRSDEVVVAGLVYFAAQRSPRGTPFVLVGSSVNVLDRWQPPDSHVTTVGTYYMDAVRAYAARLAELPDEAAQSEFTAPPFRSHGLVQALHYLAPVAEQPVKMGWAAGPVMLRGHARVLAAPNDDIWGGAPSLPLLSTSNTHPTTPDLIGPGLLSVSHGANCAACRGRGSRWCRARPAETPPGARGSPVLIDSIAKLLLAYSVPSGADGSLVGTAAAVLAFPVAGGVWNVDAAEAVAESA